jgi:prepilin-type N-terminal cleavage/methylation domain-containing protein
MKRTSGFSLLELLAVVTILGIIASIVLPRVTTSTSVAKEKTCYHNRAQINSQAEQWYIEKGAWPANNLSDIGADVNHFPDSIPVCPVSGQPYRLDPTTHRVIGHTGGGKGGSDHSP